MEPNIAIAIALTFAYHLSAEEPQAPLRESADAVGAMDLSALFATPKKASEALGERAAEFIAAAHHAELVVFDFVPVAAPQGLEQLSFEVVTPIVLRRMKRQLLKPKTYHTSPLRSRTIPLSTMSHFR